MPNPNPKVGLREYILVRHLGWINAHTFLVIKKYTQAQAISTQALYQFVEHGDRAQSWVRPLNDDVKISFDTAMFTESMSYGVGLLDRNKNGDVSK